MTPEEKLKAFETLVRPLIKWLAETQHPHTKIIIESNHAEMVEGVCSINTDDFLVDYE